MSSPEATLRVASPADAAAMAELFNMAGEGLPLYLWTRLAKPGEDAWEIGRQRARRESGGFSYRNATLLEQAGQVIGCLIGYPLPPEPEPIAYDEMPPMFVPLQELENCAPGTWYVNVLAVRPEMRKEGHGARLLLAAEQLASESGSSGLSIIVADSNSAACRLYERCGYSQLAERPMVKEEWENAGRNWILLVKSPAPELGPSGAR